MLNSRYSVHMSTLSGTQRAIASTVPISGSFVTIGSDSYRSGMDPAVVLEGTVECIEPMGGRRFALYI